MKTETEIGQNINELAKEAQEAQEEKMSLLEKYWYNMPEVQYNLYKPLARKYLSIKKDGVGGLIRYNKITAYQQILKVLEHWGVLGRPHKLYMDLAIWKEMPFFSYDPKIRETQKEEFNKKNEKGEEHYVPLIQDMDFAIDIDAEKDAEGNKKDWQSTHARAVKCKKWLERHKIPYAVWNSSDNGFQFFIFGSNWKKKKNMVKKVLFYKEMAKSIRGAGADIAVYDLRRIIKLPYSLCNGKVVLPLADEQFDKWNPQMCELKWVMAHIGLKNRGWMIRKKVNSFGNWGGN